MIKLTLHDGEKQSTSIAVILYLRNTAKYLQDFLIPKLIKFERLYDCTFFYYIFENDSTDGTISILNDFMKNRKGLFITKKLNLNTILHGSHILRIQRMVYIRNILLDIIRDKLIKHEWSLFIDADIYFDNNVLIKLMSKKPRLHNIGMLTCNTIEYGNHYYDTFAYVSIEDNFYYPNCNSKNCKNPICKYKQSKNSNAQCIDAGNPYPLDVRSAWGGLVMIHASIFRYPNIRWKTMNIGDQSICEHVYLCDMIHGITNNRIVVCGDIICNWRNT